jgi:hypothetical protein
MLDYVTIHGPATTSRWELTGDSRDNTDHGRVYADITPALVTLYKDSAMQHAVADGVPLGDFVHMTHVNDSGLTASCRLDVSTPVQVALDVFYADDADLRERHADLDQLLDDFGMFAGYLGFSVPRRGGKRTLDGLLKSRLPHAWRADDLQPLADAQAAFALSHMYTLLMTRADSPAFELASMWKDRARNALAAIRLSIGGRTFVPFTPRVTRA